VSPDSDRSREKLLKVLRLLESDKEGERAAAAHAAHRMLKNGKASIDELLAPKTPVRSSASEDLWRRAEEAARWWAGRAAREAAEAEAEKQREQARAAAREAAQKRVDAERARWAEEHAAQEAAWAEEAAEREIERIASKAKRTPEEAEKLSRWEAGRAAGCHPPREGA
jgi:colicin import membrane protein